MDLDRSILNKTNSSFKQNTDPDDNPHPSTSSSVDDAVLSHFRVDASPMSSLQKPKEPRVERRGLHYSTQVDEYHTDDRLMAMAEVVSNPSYSHQVTYYPPSHHHTTGVAARTQYHLLTPSTSPQDYIPQDFIPSAPSVPTPAATPAEEVVYGDGDATEIDPDEDRRDLTSGTLIAAGGRPLTTNASTDDDPDAIVCQFKPPELNLPPDSKECKCDLNGATPPFLRKIVSHIFGRNKTCTQLIPDVQWIWYCRKHYQRKRYDVPNWALEQIRIVRHALNRFEKWGEIRSFSVALRKREKNRGRSAGTSNVPSSRRRTTGRITASRAQTIRAKAIATATAQPVAASADASASQEPEVTSTGRRKSFPVNVASPVPEFLYAYLGDDKSFADIRHILDEIEKYVQFEQHVNSREVPFPDIEILPVFTVEFLKSQGRATGQLSENNHSRRRRARDVRLSQAQASSRINNNGRDVQYHPNTTILPSIAQALPRECLHPDHEAINAHTQVYHDTHTMGHTHLPAFPPPAQIIMRPYAAGFQ